MIQISRAELGIDQYGGFHLNRGDGSKWVPFDSLSGILKKTKEYSTEEVRLIGDEDLPLLSAPGSGKMILPNQTIIEYLAGEEPFDAGGASINISTRWAEDGAFDWFSPSGSGFLDSEVSKIYYQGYVQGLFPGEVSHFDNQGLVIIGSGGPVTDGDGKLRVTVLYSILSVI